MGIEPLDMLLAYKAIALMPGFSASERRVAGAIIDHFNRKDERCDPSVDRIASLLGVDRRTVLRAVDALDRAGVILKDRHGGRMMRNSYEPDWERFRKFELMWKAL